MIVTGAVDIFSHQSFYRNFSFFVLLQSLPFMVVLISLISFGGNVMSVYGFDFLAEDESVQFQIVEAESESDARAKAGKLLNTLGLPKRNIINLEKLDWLDK